MKIITSSVLAFILITPFLFSQAKINTMPFLDLEYRKIKPNKTTLGTPIIIQVNQSASPLFYKINKPLKTLKVSGKVNIQKKIAAGKDDVYFSVGIINKGDYKPNFLTKKLLPQWLKTIVNINTEVGVGKIQFYEASPKGIKTDKVKKYSDIVMHHKTHTQLGPDGSFSVDISGLQSYVLGLWFRAEGDDSGAIFDVQINSLEYN